MSKLNRREALSAIAGAAVGTAASPGPVYAAGAPGSDWQSPYDPAVNPLPERVILALHDAVELMYQHLETPGANGDHKEDARRDGMGCVADCPVCLCHDYGGMVYTLESYLALLTGMLLPVQGGELRRRDI